MTDFSQLIGSSFAVGCQFLWYIKDQGCIFRLTCSHPELTEDHVLTSAYVKIFKTVTRNAVNKGYWRKKNCFWLPLNKHAMNIWLNSLKIRAHLSWRTGTHLHVLHVLRTYSTYAALVITTTADVCILPWYLVWFDKRRRLFRRLWMTGFGR